MPVHEDQILFEMLILEGAHAGLSWKQCLKQGGYRAQFHHFDVQRVANMTDTDLEGAPKPWHHPASAKVFSTRKTRKCSNKFKPSTVVSMPIFGLMLMENLSSTTSRRLTTSQPQPHQRRAKQNLKRRGMSFGDHHYVCLYASQAW